MKRILSVLFFSLPLFAFGYESGLLNLVTPTTLKGGYAEFSVSHRFLTPLDKIDETLLGNEPQGGANVGLGLRLNLGRSIEVKAAYSSLHPSKGISAGVSYTRDFPKLASRFQLDVEYFSYRVSSDKREGNAFILLAWQSNPIFQRIRPTLNLGYNNYNEKFEIAPGVSIRLFEKLDVIGEYYFATDPLDLGLKNTFVFGLDYRTYGHHFMLVVSNNVENGVRRLMRGAPENTLYVGFNIYRLLQF